MSPELITAIRERIVAGQSKETVRESVLKMGHQEALFEAAYTLALSDIEKSGATTPKAAELPTTYTLVSNSFEFAKNHLTLVAFIAVPLLFLTLFSEISTQFEGDASRVGVLALLSVVSGGVYLFMLIATLHIVSQSDQEVAPSLRQGLVWAGQNLFPLFLVYLLTTLVILGGFLFFIIPGLMLIVLVYFSQYAYVLEGKQGMAALLRSRELVKGRWWTVAMKLLGFMVYFFLFVFFLTLVYELVESLLPLPDLSLAGELIMQVFAAFFTVMTMEAMFRLYRALAETETNNPAATFTKVVYWSACLLSVAAIVLIGVLAVFFKEISSFDESVPAVFDSVTLRGEVTTASMTAREYELQHGSYTGVCTELTPILASATEVECNDSEKEWAVAGERGGERWCADTTTPAKRIYSPIGDATACISL